MARTSFRHAHSLTVGLLLACSNGRLPDAPPFTGEDGSSGAATGSGGGDTSSAGGPSSPSGGAPSSDGLGRDPTAGSSPDTGGTPGTANPPNGMVPNGAYVAGNWKGRAWGRTTGVGSTMMPSSFDDVPLGTPYCASGSVVALPDYSGTATIGVNLNQEIGVPGAAENTLVPGNDGVIVNVSNRGGSALRIELRGPNAEADPSERWCAPVSGSGGFIAWSSFNTACWDGSGAAYAREPIVSASVLVPGDDEDVVPYDVCLNGIGEGSEGSSVGEPPTGTPDGAGGSEGTGGTSGGNAAGGAAGAAGKPIMNSGTLTERYDWQPVLHEGKNYVVQNNVWGSEASQSITYNGTAFKITAQAGTNGTSGAPVSYPSSFIGANFERATTDSNLPKLVSSITSIQTSWSTNATGSIAGTYNAAYDVWFSTGAAGDWEAPSGGYLMVWFYDPPNAQPIGSVVAPSVTVPGVSGTWDIWLGNNGNVPCISYVRTETIQSMMFDLNAFIQHAVNRGTIQGGWYLTNVFAGFEIWSGGVGLESSGFYAIVN